MRIILVVLAAILVVAGFGGCSTYNRLVALDEGVSSAWAQVGNVYQRRADLIPNLVETVKGAADFEKSTLTQVIEARAKATQVQMEVSSEVLNDPQAFQRFQAAQGELSGALSRLLVAVERYPELKANANFLSLQSQLEGTENRIAVERRTFNETAQTYNAQIRRIPARFVAAIAGFEKRPYFEAEPGAEKAPAVKFVD
jgi:LemA protein